MTTTAGRFAKVWSLARVSSLRELAQSGHTLPAYIWVKRRGFLMINTASDTGFRVYGKGCAEKDKDEPASGHRTPAFRGKVFDFTLTSGPPLKRTNASEKGSLLVYSNIEVRWDENGALKQDASDHQQNHKWHRC